MNKLILFGIVFILIAGFTTAGIVTITEVQKDTYLDKHTLSNLNALNISTDLELTECVVIDSKYCKFMVKGEYFFFEDFQPHLQYIKYEGKTRTQINDEMQKNTKEMLQYYSDKLDYENSIVEPAKVLVSDKISLTVKEEVIKK